MIFVRKRDTSCHSTMSFSENIAVAETSYQNNVRSFIILRSGEGFKSPPIKVTVLTFLVKKKKNEAF